MEIGEIKLMKFTGEQFLPSLSLDEAGPEISYEHWHRYLHIDALVKNKVVLDIACGEGYGSSLLSTTAKRVIGIDINLDVIKHANQRYARKNLQFLHGSVANIPVAGNSVFDVIVSFETIEHVGEEDQKTFLNEVKRLLKPRGVFIVSTPNKETYSDIPGYKNEFHIKEFYLDEFEAFLGNYFEHVKLQGQSVYPVSYLWNIDDEEKNQVEEYRLQYASSGFYPTEEQKVPQYGIAVCSDVKISFGTDSLLVDLSNQAFGVRDQYIRDLGGQIEIRENKLNLINTQLVEKEQIIQSLSAQLVEKEQIIQSLSAQLVEIHSSIMWRIVQRARRIKETLAPPGSKRSRGLGILLDKLRSFYSNKQFQQNRRNNNGQQLSVDSIIVYQPGKVGSRTVVASLEAVYKNEGLQVPIYHQHYLNDFEKFKQRAIEELPDPTSTLAAIEYGEALRHEIDENSSRNWKVITLVRDPVARIVSAVFQNLSVFFPDWKERYADGKLDFDEIQNVIIKSSTIDEQPEDWFDKQMKPVFGIDVYAEPFPHDVGYKIYTSNGRAMLLLIRLENFNQQSALAMQDFLGIRNFTIINENTSEQKDYSDLYRAFKKRPLSADFVKKMYDTKFARHFYTDAELNFFIRQWCGEVGEKLSDFYQTD